MKAFITGISGQDGYFLSKFLLEKGYEIYGLVRRNSQMSIGSLKYLPKNYESEIKLYFGDIIDTHFINSLIKEIKPDELYHLAAQSFVETSFKNPIYTFNTNVIGTLNAINPVRVYSNHTKFYFAATSELFGDTKISPQNEKTPFAPNSPYAISKLAGYWITREYRESYNIFACNGILFNHESEFRGPEFVTRKITLAVAKIANGSSEPLILGNLNSRKDWGYAGDYVKAMWSMLQQKKADDYVIATGEQHTVKEFVEAAFNVIGIRLVWSGSGVKETAKDLRTGKILVKVDEKFFRPVEAENFLGDYSKAKKILRWKPSLKFKELVQLMVESDLNRTKYNSVSK